MDYYLVLSIFIGDDPAWKCSGDSPSINLTRDFCTLHPNVTVHPDSMDFGKRCLLGRERWDYVTPSSYSYVTEFDLTCDQKYLAALSASALYIGGCFGIFTASLMDIFGRKTIIWLSMFMINVLTVGCFFVTNIWQLIYLRIALGCFVFTVYNGLMVWLLEFLPARSRSLAMCLLTCAFATSSLLLNLVAYQERNWRQLSLYMCIPAIISLFVFIPMPKSPRWLAGKNRTREAVDMLNSIRKCNGMYEMEIVLEKEENSSLKNYTYLDIVKNRKFVCMSLYFAAMYFTLSFIYYEIALEGNYYGGSIYITFLFTALADIPGYLLALYLCDKIGRKYAQIFGLFLAALSLGLVGVIPPAYSHAYAVRLSLAIFSKIFVNLAYNASFLWVLESYPTVLRSQGYGICVFFDRLGPVCVPLLSKYLNTVNSTLIYVIIGVLGVFLTLFGLSRTDTKDKPMYDV